MDQTTKGFFNEYWMMQPLGDDSLLFSAEYASLSSDFTADMAKEALASVYHPNEKLIGPFNIDRWYYKLDSEYWTRDNEIARLALSKRFNLDYHKHFLVFDLFRRLQPRDLVFWLFARGDLLSNLALPFLPILSLSIIINVLFPSYTNNILDTSGVLLDWTILNNFNLPLTQKLCNYIVKKRIGNYSEYFRVYFGPNHPSTLAAQQKGI